MTGVIIMQLTDQEQYQNKIRRVMISEQEIRDAI